MIFRLSSTLLTSTDIRKVDVLTFLRAAAHRGHTVLVTDEPLGFSADRSTVLGAWVSKLNLKIRQEVDWLVERIARISPNSVTRGAVTVAILPPTEIVSHAHYVVLELAAAIRLAAAPLRLLVEDGLSEAAFLRRVMPPVWRKRFDEWLAGGVIYFEHGGDSPVLNESFAEALIKSMPVVLD